MCVLCACVLVLICCFVVAAIVALKEELIQCRRRNVEPVFEEFIPLKKSCDEAEKDEKTRMEKESKEKKNWMSSVQLWNSTDDQNKQDADLDSCRKPNSVVEIAKVVYNFM